MANKTRLNSWTKANFINMLTPLRSAFGVSNVEKVVDIKVLNNTVVIEIVDTRINKQGGRVPQQRKLRHPHDLL